MNKKIILLCIILIVLAGVIFSVNMFYQKGLEEKKEQIRLSEKVTDDCIEERPEEIERVSSTEETVSPNCKITLKKSYKKCGHTKEEEIRLPEEMVNMTQKQVEEEYSNWEVIGFSKDEIVLYQELDKECGEHYKIIDEDGFITIYKIDENSVEEFYEQTDIPTQYLPAEDKTRVKNGINICGIEELNKTLEDFE